MEELVYEAQVNSLEELISLTYSFGKQVKFKKPTDKNWYYAKTLIKRLFKKDLEKLKPLIKHVGCNDLAEIERAKYVSMIADELKKKEEEEWEKFYSYTTYDLEEMSVSELIVILIRLYTENYKIYESDFSEYYYPVESELEKIACIELQISPKLSDFAYKEASRVLSAKKITNIPERIPLYKIFRITDDYALFPLEDRILKKF